MNRLIYFVWFFVLLIPIDQLSAQNKVFQKNQNSDKKTTQTAIKQVDGSLDTAESSGIVRKGNELLIVSDEYAGAFFRFDLTAVSLDSPVQLSGKNLELVSIPGGSFAKDLEEIDFLADGRIVVLSERLRSLIAEDGNLVIEYDDPFAEVADRGLEGLAIRGLPSGTSLVAALWEGGNMVEADLSAELGKLIANHAFRPVIVLQEIKAGEKNHKQRPKNTSANELIVLDIPKSEETATSMQSFRATDLIWHKQGPGEEWGFIVLLNSFEKLWLQRFDKNGKSVGEHFDINSAVPDQLKNLNWEGISWDEEGKSILLIDDKSEKRDIGPAFVVKVRLPESWSR